MVKGKSTFISQGFIGSSSDGMTTTLGREGFTHSAAIFAYALAAESVTIWKDVPGVLNGDPRQFEDTVLLNQISYREAIELAFYGASVIHPKNSSATSAERKFHCMLNPLKIQKILEH